MFSTKANARRAGKEDEAHWFAPDAMRSFNTVIESDMIHGRYFITSERENEYDIKRATIREALPDGKVQTVGEFRKYESVQDAYNAAAILPY